MSNFIKHVLETDSILLAPGRGIKSLGSDVPVAATPAGSTSGTDITVTAGSDYVIVDAQEFVAGAALVNGDVVALDASAATNLNTVVLATSGSAADIVIGVVMSTSVASGDPVLVLMKGLHPYVKVTDAAQAGIAVGDTLIISATAGEVEEDVDDAAVIERGRVGTAVTVAADLGTNDDRIGAWITPSVW